MHVTEVTGQKKVPVIVEVLEKVDLRKITKARFFFKWEQIYNEATLYKLVFADKPIIIGLMALVDFPSEYRIEIKLLAASADNVGKQKYYEGIAGCLITYAVKQSLEKYGSLACVSLKPKTEIRQHYINRYGMQTAGQQLFLEDAALFNMINIYDI